MAKVHFFLQMDDFGVLTNTAGDVCVDTNRGHGWYALSPSGQLMGPYASKRDAEHNYYALKGDWTTSDEVLSKEGKHDK